MNNKKKVINNKISSCIQLGDKLYYSDRQKECKWLSKECKELEKSITYKIERNVDSYLILRNARWSKDRKYIILSLIDK